MYHVNIYADIHTPRLRYTVAFLAGHPLSRQATVVFQLGGDHSLADAHISYGRTGSTPRQAFSIPAQAHFFEAAGAIGPLSANAYEYGDETLYSVETSKKPPPIPLLHDGHFQFDLLETIFFHISRYEEVFCRPEHKDDVGWYREQEHFLVRHQLEQRPVVDQLVRVLLEIILGRKLHFPTTYDLSHDIDVLFRFPSPYKFVRSMAGSVYRRQSWPAILRSAGYYLQYVQGKLPDPYDCYDWLFSPLPHWMQKTLYLMAGGETRYDNFYAIDHPAIPGIIDTALRTGYHIGLHPSYNAAFKLALFRREKQKLEAVAGRTIRHSRQHWLRFDWAVTPYFYDDLGIREDASLGYRRRLGFRCGTGFPYRLYDFRGEKAFSWQERPLAFMESCAIHQSVRTGLPLTMLMEGFLHANAHNTHLSFNFHNSNFDPTQASGRTLAHFYRQVVLPLGK